MSYTAKARLVSMALPVLVIAGFAAYGLRATHSLFAAPAAPAVISVFTEKQTYRIGEPVTVTITNGSTKAVSVANNCPDAPLAVYRLDDGSLTSLHDQTDIAKCAGEPRSYQIPPGSSVHVSYQYWTSLFRTPGTYRIVAELQSYASAPSTEFTVEQ